MFAYLTLLFVAARGAAAARARPAARVAAADRVGEAT
jgi:hypothetical protein